MEGADSDAPNHKRLRLDSANPVFNGRHPHPPPPPAKRHPSHPPHPTSTQASSPTTASRPYPPHSLPPPTYPSSGPPHFAPHQPSPSLPPSDIRHLPDPRNIPSPGHRPHGLPGTPVTLPARNTIPQDSISTYRPPPTPQSAAPDIQSSHAASFGDAKPPMEPGPWPGNPDPRHPPHSNGYPPVVSPPHPAEPPYQTPPVQPGSQHYGQPPPNAYTPAPYMNQYVPGPGQMRRKQVRATQACNHCRARKQKCDEARPCQFCRENNFDCQYKDVPPPKQDRSMMQLQDGINNISDTLANFIDNFNMWKQSVDSRLALPRGSESVHMAMDHASPGHVYGGRGSVGDIHHSRMPTPSQTRSQLRRTDSIKTESPTVPHSHVSPVPVFTSTPVEQKSMMATPQPPATPADSIDNAHTIGSTADKAHEGLQSDHTTPAHLLLTDWPHMETFCHGIMEFDRFAEVSKKVSDYPMQFEQDRGLLRVWGVGEGNDANDGAQGPSSPDSNADSDAPSPGSSKEGIWGCPPIDHSSPSTVGGETPRHFGYHGGLGSDGRPDFRLSTLTKLGNSYHEHIHCLHPFLNPSKLRKMINDFGAIYSPEARSGRTSTLSPAGVPDRLNPGIKRKRSSIVLGDGYGLAEDLSKGGIERSLRNAIVLLVLALGKVCEHKDPLPAPQSDRNNTLANGNWGYTRDSPLSASNSFNSDDTDLRPRNIDILPGMAYYSYATDILGNQQGGNTVAHAQAMILAALYLSQFARVLESWSWINNACRICLVLVKADYDKITRGDLKHKRDDPPKEVYRLNLVKCVYWTCLQLETDILAEMSTLPPTDVSKYQDEISYPSGVYENFPEGLPSAEDNGDLTLWIYSSLIHLRVILNGAHNTLYAAKGKHPLGYNQNNLKDVGAQAQSIANILKLWRNSLPRRLDWKDDEEPSSDINVARLRAKYYGGLYMVLRPFLRIAVEQTAPGKSPGNILGASTTPTGTTPWAAPVSLNPDNFGLVKECIQSAIQSTIAFDRVNAVAGEPYTDYRSQRRGRLILTNIFGTLHAQFGNMILLAAVYKSPLRHQLEAECELNRMNLSALFYRTMKILDEVAPNSPILRMDLKILENVKRELGLS